jgi:NAD(P)-dependent dehydrogenase (short-subunit alcohol dehydrogenase family)
MESEPGREFRSLAGCTALVTGASSGIGQALSIALSREGVHVCALGRDPGRLAQTVAAAQKYTPVTAFSADLTVDGDIQRLFQYLERAGTLDVLVHSAAVLFQDLIERARVEDLDAQYAINVRAPYRLTQQLLPLLIAARGQIVFINSSVGLAAKRAEIGQYAATKHALRAFADCLREEVNPKGVRVLSAYLGRTATPMQESVFRAEGRPYRPDSLLQPEDVAAVIVHALKLPPTAEVTDIHVRPMRSL